MGCKTAKKVEEVYSLPKDASQLDEIKEVADLTVKALDADMDLHNKVELSLKCDSLPIQDRSSLTSSMCVLYSQEDSGHWVEEGRTEIQKFTRNPEFNQSFKVSYCFEKQLQCKIEVFVIKETDSRQYLGTAYFNIHEVVCAPAKSIQKHIENKFKPGQDMGKVSVCSEEATQYTHIAHMDWAFESDSIRGALFLTFYRCSNNEVAVHQTEVKMTRPLRWNRMNINLNKLCLGDQSKPVKVHLCKSERHARFIIGTSHFTIEQVQSETRFPVYNNDKQVGTLVLRNFDIEEKYSFLDYIFGGCEISLMVGIDFTKSNGLPHSSSSLHFWDDNSPNEYIQAIRAVGNILQYYDSDKKVPVFGFGAKLPPTNLVSHCFALNGNIFDPEIYGIQEVETVYKKIISQVTFHGPTIFHEIIDMACAYSSNSTLSQDNQQYFILLILTDGIINDIDETIDSLVTASDLPISVIIVGVGSEDFSMMQVLDADITPLYSKFQGRKATRDIVQFVPFSKFRGNNYELAKEVLYEIPEQLTSFMMNNGIFPNHVHREAFARAESSAIVYKKQRTMGETMHPASLLLSGLREQFLSDLVDAGINRQRGMSIIKDGFPCLDPKMAAEMVRKLPNSNLKSAFKNRRSSTMRIPGQVHFQQQEIICFLCDNTVDTVLSCGHKIACHDCVEGIGGVCPACQKHFSSWSTL